MRTNIITFYAPICLLKVFKIFNSFNVSRVSVRDETGWRFGNPILKRSGRFLVNTCDDECFTRNPAEPDCDD